jgi:predicted nucleotidyltransferase
MITTQQVAVIREITGKLNPVMVGIFGSYARNEQTEESDLDVLIDFDSRIDLLDLIGLEQELSEILGVKVDLITVKSVDERLRPYIQKDLIRII